METNETNADGHALLEDLDVWNEERHVLVHLREGPKGMRQRLGAVARPWKRKL